MRQRHHFFASCPRGLETPLVQELESLGAINIQSTEGGVSFFGDSSLMYKANLHSRIASRILWKLQTKPYRNEQDIYKSVREIHWPELFQVSRTIKVSVTSLGSQLRSLEFVTLKIKDAICDVFRAKTGERPSIDTSAPDVRIHAFLTETHATLYLDTSGESLFKRGYRQQTGEAPLRENLAAGILKLTGWQPEEPLLDPMCGSGTFLIEAAMIAQRIAPGAYRSFGFEALNSFDAALWNELRNQARAAERNAPMQIYGSDRDLQALSHAQANLENLGIDDIPLDHIDVLERTAPTDSGVLLCNPPYGIRVEEQEALADFYPQLGNTLKQHFSGWRAYFFTGDLRLAKLIHLSASKRIVLFNGPLECRLFEYKMVTGNLRKKDNTD